MTWRRSVLASGLAVVALLAAACSDDDADQQPTSTAPSTERFATDGLTFAYSTEVFTGAELGSPPDDEVAVVAGLQIAGDDAQVTVRATTVRDLAGAEVELQSEAADALSSVEARMADGEDPVRFVNGSGFVEEAAASWRFAGLTDDERLMVEIDAGLPETDRDAITSALDALAGSVFADPSAASLSVGDCEPSVEVVGEVVVADGPTAEPGSVVSATWPVRNTGPCAWTALDRWVFTGGDPVTLVETSSLDGVGSGDEVDVTVTFLAPDQVGSVSAQWQLQPAGSREVVGPPVPVTIEVVER